MSGSTSTNLLQPADDIQRRGVRRLLSDVQLQRLRHGQVRGQQQRSLKEAHDFIALLAGDPFCTSATARCVMRCSHQGRGSGGCVKDD